MRTLLVRIGAAVLPQAIPVVDWLDAATAKTIDPNPI